MGNGYAITAVLGNKYVMENSKDSFISSTFWTERIGPTAALKTLETMEKKKSWIDITKKGKYVKKMWKELAAKNNLKIQISGLDSLASFKLQYDDWNLYKTFIAQEMRKKNMLATNVIYLSTAHTYKLLDNYLKKLDSIFKQIKMYEESII